MNLNWKRHVRQFRGTSQHTQSGAVQRWSSTSQGFSVWICSIAEAYSSPLYIQKTQPRAPVAVRVPNVGLRLLFFEDHSPPTGTSSHPSSADAAENGVCLGPSFVHERPVPGRPPGSGCASFANTTTSFTALSSRYCRPPSWPSKLLKRSKFSSTSQ